MTLLGVLRTIHKETHPSRLCSAIVELLGVLMTTEGFP